MAAPSSYTEESLAQFMLDVLGEVANVLGIDSTTNFDEEVSDSLLLYGVDDIADATDIRKLRACARYSAWRKAYSQFVTKFTFQTDQQRFERSDMGKAARTQLALVESDLVSLGVVTYPAIETGLFVFPEDPYEVVTDEDYVD